jgi:hypothetical protein
MLHRIAGKDHGIGPLHVYVRDTAPQAFGAQLGCRMLRPWQKYVGIADLRY